MKHKDPRVSLYEVGGDILQTDILDAAMKQRRLMEFSICCPLVVTVP